MDHKECKDCSKDEGLGLLSKAQWLPDRNNKLCGDSNGSSPEEIRRKVLIDEHMIPKDVHSRDKAADQDCQSLTADESNIRGGIYKDMIVARANDYPRSTIVASTIDTPEEFWKAVKLEHDFTGREIYKTKLRERKIMHFSNRIDDHADQIIDKALTPQCW